MPHLGFQNEVLDDLQIAPPYCDLWVQEIETKPDHNLKRLNVSAVIGNRGQAPPNGPILVTTYVLADVYSPQYGYWIQVPTTEYRWYTSASLPFRTLQTWASLYYVEEGGGAYQVYVTVGDPENHAGDRNPNNNLKVIQCPPFYNPATFHEKMNEPLRQESRMEDGKLKSMLTIGGEPIK